MKTDKYWNEHTSSSFGLKSIDKNKVFESAFVRWGYDRQIIKLAEESSELSVAACKFVGHSGNGKALAEECADVEIMIEQVRHNGLHSQIDAEKERKLARLALMLEGCEDIDAAPDMQRLRGKLDQIEHFFMEDCEALTDAFLAFDFHLASNISRRAAGRLMHMAQLSARIARVRSIPSPARSEAK